jgi:hypothetical protein
MTLPLRVRTPAQKRRFTRLVGVIDKGILTFLQVGQALLEIDRDNLYPETYSTFKAWCQDHLGRSAQRAYQWMAAARAVENLSTTVDIPPPQNERQARPMIPFAPEDQRTIWRDTHATTNGQPTAEAVEEAAERRREELKREAWERLTPSQKMGVIQANEERLKVAALPRPRPSAGDAQRKVLARLETLVSRARKLVQRLECDVDRALHHLDGFLATIQE